MAVPSFRHFTDYSVEEKNDNIRILNENKKLIMIGIKCEEQHLIALHGVLRQLSKDSVWIPNIVPPSKFGEREEIRMAVKCDNGKTLDRYEGTWFFESVWVYDKLRRQWNSRPLYATVIFKKFIWNLIRLVKDFLTKNFRPVLQLNKIFVSKAGDVICSEYELRDPAVHTDAEEAKQVGDLLESLVNLKASNCETLLVEFQELSKWLLSSHFQTRTIDEALEQVVFWDRDMRVDFILRLSDAVSNSVQIARDTYNRSGLAFKVGSETNWRKILGNGPSHPLFQCLLDIGDSHYMAQLQNGNNPSRYRTDTMTSMSAVDILCCGLVRLRDGCSHAGQNGSKLLVHYLPTVEILRDVHVQSIFQDVYPSHMAEFAKSKGLITFNVGEKVQGLLDRSYVEDASSSVQRYLDA